MRKTGRLLGCLILLGLLGWRTDWGHLVRAFVPVDLRLCLLAAAVLVVTQVISSWRWLLLARVHSFDGNLGRFTAYYFIGMLFNLVLPTSVGGDVVRGWYLAAQEGSPPPPGRRLAAFLTVFAERFTGVLMLIVLGCSAALFCPVALERWISVCIGGVVVAAVTGLLVLWWLPRLDNAPATGVFRLLRNNQTVRRLAEAFGVYHHHPGVVLLTLGMSLVVQLGNVVMVWLLSRALGLGIPFLYLGVVVPLVALLTLLPITINGMGLRAAGMVVLLGPQGVIQSQAVCLAFLHFALCATLSLVGGLSCYLFGHFPRFERTPVSLTLASPPEGVESVGVAGQLRKGIKGSSDEESVRGNPDQGRAGQPPAAA